MSFTKQESIEACAAHYGDQAEAMRDYLVEGERAAIALGNRGPARFDRSGQLAAEIRECYSENGFYVFEDVVNATELQELQAAVEAMAEKFPERNGDALTAKGEPALGADCTALTLLWSKPLGDPLGGTALANGRHQIKLFEPQAKQGGPDEAVFIILGALQFSEALLRTYAHPDLLRIAASINGEDFTPFNETLFVKEPGIGAAVSWHQDGDTHWESPDFDEDIHGFNFMVQLHGSTAVNGVWALPGSHRTGRIDIQALVEQAGSERIKGAVPMLCKPGDVVMSNRQLLHGSFANTGLERRITHNFGFHKRSSIVNQMGAGIHSEPLIYDDALIERRSRALGLALNARKQHFPQETPYDYKPLSGRLDTFEWNDAALASLKDYNLEDLGI